ncbi:MAG: glycosyltransferase [Planctomycetota bacterium]
MHDVFSALRDDLAHRAFRDKKRRAYRELATHADLIVAVSSGTRQDFLQLYPDAERKIAVVPHGVDPAFHPRRDGEVAAVRARLRLPERYLLFVGLLSTRKNCVRMIQAFEQIAPSTPSSRSCSPADHRTGSRRSRRRTSDRRCAIASIAWASSTRAICQRCIRRRGAAVRDAVRVASACRSSRHTRAAAP